MDFRLIAALPLVALAACTSRLELEPLKPLVDGKQSAATIPSGVPYNLYYDRFSISVTYRIADCDKLTLEVEPSVKEVIAEPDPDQSYVLNPNSLAGPLKTSTVSLKYHPDGSLASINAKAEDRTAETVGALAKSAAGLIKIFGAAGSNGNEATKPATCKQETRPMFDAYAAFTAKKGDKVGGKPVETNGELVAAKEAIDQAQADFDAAKSKLDASGALVSKPVQTQFNNAFLSLQGATRRLAAAKTRLVQLAKPISVTFTTIWPDSGSQTQGTIAAPLELEAALVKWSDGDPNRGAYGLFIKLVSTQPGGMGANAGLAKLERNDLSRGLPYRSPARGMLEIGLNTVVGNEIIPQEPVFQEIYMVRQLGRVFQLPCISKPFTSISCSLAFDPKGQLTKAGTDNTKAPLEGAAGLIGSLVESGGSAADTFRAGAEKRAGAATKAKQDELADLELDAKLTSARNALKPDDDAAVQKAKEAKILEFETDLKLKNARKALAEAQSQVAQ